MNRRKLFFLTAWLVGCSLVFFTIRELPLAGMLERLGEISPLRLVGLLAINSLILFSSVKRWQILAQVFDIQLPLAHLFKVRQAGNTISPRILKDQNKEASMVPTPPGIGINNAIRIPSITNMTS